MFLIIWDYHFFIIILNQLGKDWRSKFNPHVFSLTKICDDRSRHADLVRIRDDHADVPDTDHHATDHVHHDSLSLADGHSEVQKREQKKQMFN